MLKLSQGGHPLGITYLFLSIIQGMGSIVLGQVLPLAPNTVFQVRKLKLNIFGAANLYSNA